MGLGSTLNSGTLVAGGTKTGTICRDDATETDVPHFSLGLSRRFAGRSLGPVEGVEGPGFDVRSDVA
jgi:hypothetical protein